jgi:threonine synthase
LPVAHWLTSFTGKIGKDESTVICITGNGLKTQEALQGQVISPHFIKPNIGSFEEALDKINK